MRLIEKDLLREREGLRECEIERAVERVRWRENEIERKREIDRVRLREREIWFSVRIELDRTLWGF